jgi:hypothetical protein
MSDQDVALVHCAETLKHYQTEIDRLRELLRPFARAAAALRPDAPDSEPVVILAGEVILTAGDFRAARRTIDN